MGFGSHFIGNSKLNVDESWFMQAQDEEDKRGAAEAGEEDDSGFKEGQTNYKE